MKATEKRPKVYVLWAEGTDRFKIGYTADPIRKRCTAIDYMSPIPLRVVAVTPGDRAKERDLHFALRSFRTHGEWFRLPEDAAWWLFDQCGVDVEAVKSAPRTLDDQLLLENFRASAAC
jgi:hypothetical protein